MAPKLKTPRVPDRVARASTRVTVAADRGRDWVERQEPGTRKGATIGWFRRYRDADGQLYAVLLTAYIFISVLPVAVVMESSLAADPKALADHLVRRFSLTGAAATTTRSVLDGTSSNRAGAILFAIAVTGVNAIGQLMFLPAYPFWALAMFTLDILIIFGLATYSSSVKALRT